MFIRIGYELIYDIPAANPILLMLYVRPEVSRRLPQPELRSSRASSKDVHRRFRQRACGLCRSRESSACTTTT